MSRRPKLTPRERRDAFARKDERLVLRALSPVHFLKVPGIARRMDRHIPREDIPPTLRRLKAKGQAMYVNGYGWRRTPLGNERLANK